MRSLVFGIVLLHLTFFLGLPSVSAQTSDETQIGKIISMRAENKEFAGQILPVTIIDALILKGSQRGSVITLDQPPTHQGENALRIGDKVLISASRTEDREPVYYITDIVRTDALLVLSLVFVTISLAVAGWHGIRSLIGLGASFFVLLTVIMPRLYSGHDPVTTTVFGSLIIAPLTFYLTHGLSRKTGVALAGTAIALVITAFLAKLSISFGRLTGYASEEVQFLQIAQGGNLNPQGILLSGIIIGTLGVLDDVTISQASLVNELRKVNRSLSNVRLFFHAMQVGRDHIAATVNTLVLVYTGAALPLLLLFLNTSQPLQYLLNYEVVAEEIIRMLAGSSGLILAVPVTTLLAVYIRIDEGMKSK